MAASMRLFRRNTRIWKSSSLLNGRLCYSRKSRSANGDGKAAEQSLEGADKETSVDPVLKAAAESAARAVIPAGESPKAIVHELIGQLKGLRGNAQHKGVGKSVAAQLMEERWNKDSVSGDKDANAFSGIRTQSGGPLVRQTLEAAVVRSKQTSLLVDRQRSTASVLSAVTDSDKSQPRDSANASAHNDQLRLSVRDSIVREHLQKRLLQQQKSHPKDDAGSASAAKTTPEEDIFHTAESVQSESTPREGESMSVSAQLLKTARSGRRQRDFISYASGTVSGDGDVAPASEARSSRASDADKEHAGLSVSAQLTMEHWAKSVRSSEATEVRRTRAQHSPAAEAAKMAGSSHTLPDAEPAGLSVSAQLYMQRDTEPSRPSYGVEAQWTRKSAWQSQAADAPAGQSIRSQVFQSVMENSRNADSESQAVESRKNLSIIDQVRAQRPVRNSHDTYRLFEGQRLNIFQLGHWPITSTTEHDGDKWTSLWAFHARDSMKIAAHAPPRNAFEEQIEWTQEGKLWTFPIDNEAGMEEEQAVPFYEHVFLEKHLASFPKKGPVRHFMELVANGLSKNPYVSVKEKVAHIKWFKDYFAGKEKYLEDTVAAAEPLKTAS